MADDELLLARLYHQPGHGLHCRSDQKPGPRRVLGPRRCRLSLSERRGAQLDVQPRRQLGDPQAGRAHPDLLPPRGNHGQGGRRGGRRSPAALVPGICATIPGGAGPRSSPATSGDSSWGYWTYIGCCPGSTAATAGSGPASPLLSTCCSARWARKPASTWRSRTTPRAGGGWRSCWHDTRQAAPSCHLVHRRHPVQPGPAPGGRHPLPFRAIRFWLPALLPAESLIGSAGAGVCL